MNAAATVKTRRLAAGRITSTRWWKAYLALAAGRCAYCHALEEPLTIEHVRPLSLGGTNTPENLLPVCSECNHLKSNLTLSQFVAEWEFPLADEGIPHPLGQIVAGQWVWSEAALRIQDWRNRTAARRGSTGSASGDRKRDRSPSFADIAYAAAYDA